MSEDTLTCPRCNEAVSELRFIPPDLLTKDIIEDVETYDQDLTDEGGLQVCDDCMDELDGD